MNKLPDCLQEGAWRQLYEGSEAVIFIVDCTDVEHLVDAKREFWFLLTEAALMHCHVLVLAHKRDQPEAMTIADIIEGLELDSIHGRDWCKFKVHTCCVSVVFQSISARTKVRTYEQIRLHSMYIITTQTDTL